MNTRKFMLVALLVLLGVNAADLQAKARTTFIPRSVSYDLTMELAMTNYWWYHTAREEETDRCVPVSFVLSPFYMKSRNGCELSKFFLPNDKTQLSFQEDGLGDINPPWLQLMSAGNLRNYDAKVQIAPERKVFGGYFNLNLDFSKWCENVWLRINFAAMRVSHDLNFREYPSLNAQTNANANNIRTVADALNNPDWLAGKWALCPRQRSGVDDIQLKLGKDWFCDCKRVSLYLVGGIPTGQRPNAQYIFEPLVGSRHGFVGVGIDAEHTIWDDGNFSFVAMADARYRYGFKGTECRSFDICPNGQLSRYLLVTTQANALASQTTGVVPPLAASSNGINTFTASAEVTPRSTFDLWLALHAQYCDWNLELGYNFWWRQREKVCFCTGLPINVAIYPLGSTINPPAQSASAATISEGIGGLNPIPYDSVFTSLAGASSIDLDSAAHPTVDTNKLYAAVSHNKSWCNHEVMVGFAGSYEFASRHNQARALEQIAFWMNLGITF